MPFAYIVKKEREFRLPSGERFKTGDMVQGDAARQLEKEGQEHLLHHVIRIEEPRVLSVLAKDASNAS